MEVNFLAVLVAAIANVLFGMIWWSNMLFGQKWRKLMGMGDMSKAEVKKKMKEQTPAHITSFVTSLLAAFFLANFIILLQVTTPAEAFKVASMIWVGFVATTSLVDYKYAGRKCNLWAINYFYSLFGFVIMSQIILAFG